MTPSRVAALAAILVATLGTPSVADVVSDWGKAVVPPPPELKEVTVEPATTALLLLDIMKGGCSARPRCIAAMPNIKRLHDAARSHNMVVWYSLVGSDGKATPDDVMDAAIKPRAGEWYRQGGPDKFLGNDLDQRLKAHNTKTVILCGTSAQGVGLGTGTAAAQRGYFVIYPVDCLRSESAFREAYATWHMGGGGPPVTTKWVTVTRSDMITIGQQ